MKRLWLLLVVCGALLASGLVVGGLAAGGRGAAAAGETGGPAATGSLAAGAVFSPTETTGFGWAGTTVVYTETLTNSSGASDLFTLTLGGHVWTATLSPTQTGVLAPGAGVTVTVRVDIPAGAGEGTSDTVTLYAASHLSPVLVSTATLTTRVPRPGYVLNYGANQINILDTVSHANTGLFIDTTPYGVTPFGGALSPDGKWLYATLYLSNTVLVINTATHTPVLSIPVNTKPWGVAFTPDSAYAFVTSAYGNAVSVIDVARQVVTATIPVSDRPHHVAASPCSRKVYVTQGESDSVSVIDTDLLTVTKVITGLPGAYGILVSPYGDRAYVTNQNNFTIGVIDTVSDCSVAAWLTNTGPNMKMDLTPDGRTLYVAHGGNGKALVLDTANGQVITQVSTGLALAWEVEVFPAGTGHWAYINDFSEYVPGRNIAVIDTRSNTVIKSISVPGILRDMVLFPPPTVCASRVYLPLVLRR